MKSRKEYIINPESALDLIRSGMEKKEHLYVLFLEAGVIESYLRNLIGISGDPKIRPNRKSSDYLVNLSFKGMLHLNQILGNVKDPLYKNLVEFIKERNDFAHNIIQFDFEAPEVKEELEKVTKKGLAIFRKISNLYLDKRLDLSLKDELENTKSKN